MKPLLLYLVAIGFLLCCEPIVADDCAKYSNSCSECVIHSSSSSDPPSDCVYCISTGACEPQNQKIRPMCDTSAVWTGLWNEGGWIKTCPTPYPRQAQTMHHHANGTIHFTGNWNALLHGVNDHWTQPLGIVPVDSHTLYMGENNSLPYQPRGRTGITYDIINNATTYDVLAFTDRTLTSLPRNPIRPTPRWYDRLLYTPLSPWNFTSQSSGTAASGQKGYIYQDLHPSEYFQLTPSIQLGILYVGTDVLYWIDINLKIQLNNGTISWVNVSNIHGMPWDGASERGFDGEFPWPCTGCDQKLLGHYAGASINPVNGSMTNTSLGVFESIITYINFQGGFNGMPHPAPPETERHVRENGTIIGFEYGVAIPYKGVGIPAVMILAMSYAAYCYPTQGMKIQQIDGIPPNDAIKPLAVVGTRALITCDNGYGLFPRRDTNNVTAVCQSDGTLQTDGQTISCTPYMCPHLTISHATVSNHTSLVSMGTEVIVTCDDGYYIQGSDERTSIATVICQQDVWTSVTCVRECPFTPPAHSIISTSSSSINLPGTIINITCENGWMLEHNTSSTITCREDFTWNLPISQCYHTCPSLPPIPSYLSSVNLPYALIGDILIFTCTDPQSIPSTNMSCHCGDHTNTSRSITCQHDDAPRWEPQNLPECKAASIVDGGTPRPSITTSTIKNTSTLSILIPIIIIILLSLTCISFLLFHPRCIPIPGARLEPGHLTWFPQLSTPFIHHMMRSSVIHVLPMLISCIQVIISCVLLGLNRMSVKDDGSGVAIVGSCHAYLSNSFCRLSHATGALVLIYIIFTLIINLIFLIPIIITRDTYGLVYTIRSHRCASVAMIAQWCIILIWLAGPHQIYLTYTHLTLTPIAIVTLILCFINVVVWICHTLHIEHSPARAKPMDEPIQEGIPRVVELAVIHDDGEEGQQHSPIASITQEHIGHVAHPPASSSPSQVSRVNIEPQQDEEEPAETWQDVNDIREDVVPSLPLGEIAIPENTDAICVLNIESPGRERNASSRSHPFSPQPLYTSAPVTQLNIQISPSSTINYEGPVRPTSSSHAMLPHHDDDIAILSSPSDMIRAEFNSNPNSPREIGGVALWNVGRISLAQFEGKEGEEKMD